MTSEDFIVWMRKELYEMLYRREVDHDVLMVYLKLIHKWRMKNENSN